MISSGVVEKKCNCGSVMNKPEFQFIQYGIQMSTTLFKSGLIRMSTDWASKIVDLAWSMLHFCVC